MSADRPDHAAVARKYIADALDAALGALTADPAVIVALLAQSHATLALVEQQRIANDLLREVVNHVTGADS